MKLYEGGKQYNSKTNLWKAIKTNMTEIEPAKEKKLTKPMLLKRCLEIKM